jgi:glycosyltransferase involved in cell wall biosynthesis
MSMDYCKISILTPTLARGLPVIERCIRSVSQQSFRDWEHIICSDGRHELGVERLVQHYGDKRRKYVHLSQHVGHYGAAVREALLDVAVGEYLAFVDDDNIIFPKFAERMVDALEDNPDAGFAICQIVKCTPLPPEHGLAPIVISGIPPVRRNIDALQVVVRKQAMLKTRWCLNGYESVGYTCEKLANEHRWIAVDEVLGVKI